MSKKKATADYMQEDAFKQAVIPMLEQAYKQGYEDCSAEIADIVNVAIGDNGPLFDHSKMDEVQIWWDRLVSDVRNHKFHTAKPEVEE